MSARFMRVAAWVIGLLIIAAIIGYTAHVAQQRDYQSCLETNRGRATLRTLAVKIVDADGYRSTADDRTIAIVNEGLAPRDCEALR